MAIVYGYFQSEEAARLAARRCEEMGVTSAVLDSVEFPASGVDEIPTGVRRRENLIVRSGLIGAAVFGFLGLIIWFLIPGLHDKLFLAGPLMTAMYGAGVGVAAGMWFGPRMGRGEDISRAEILTHPAADRVVVVNINDQSVFGVEEMLEAAGAIEVIHRAA